MVRRSILVAFLTITGLALATSAARAEPYRNEVHHFSLRLPKGWQAMDADQLSVINQGSSPGAADHFIAGFVPTETSQLSDAHVLLSVEKLPLEGLTMDEVTAELRRSVGQQLSFSVEAENAPSQMPSTGEARLDPRNRRVAMRMPPETTGLGEIHTYSVISLGKDGLVAVHCSSLNDEFPKAVRDFRTLASSLKFDEGYQFEPAATSKSKWTSSRGLIKFIVMGVIFVGSLVVAWFKKKPKDKPTEKLQWGGPAE